MTIDRLLNRIPELKEIMHLFRYEIQKAQRPANEVILADDDVMRILKISRRKLQYLKAERKIPYHYFEPGGSRTYYLLADILEVLKENRVETIFHSIKIK